MGSPLLPTTPLVFDPWLKELALRGVKFYLRTPVKKILIDDQNEFKGFATSKIFKQSELGTKNKIWVEEYSGKNIPGGIKAQHCLPALEIQRQL